MLSCILGLSNYVALDLYWGPASEPKASFSDDPKQDLTIDYVKYYNFIRSKAQHL